MSSLALMRWLESTPERYDAGMRLITFGRCILLQASAAAAAAPVPGTRVLEIGCGTGAVTERLVARGARVTALDQDPAMLEQARARLHRIYAGRGTVDWLERTASEIDTLPTAGFDSVVASFSLSEMSALERAFVLQQAKKRLTPHGVLAVADEVVPARRGQRLLVGALRAPQAALGWLLAGSLSHPIRELRTELSAAGFWVQHERRWLLGSLGLFVAQCEEPQSGSVRRAA